MTSSPSALIPSRDIYAIAHWSDGYFDIDQHGRVIVIPHRAHPGVVHSLPDIIAHIRQQGLDLPVLLRFSDILKDRVEQLHAAFESARAKYDYRGRYTPIYPVKVNQQRCVIDALLEAGKDGRVGLEAGSKSELLAIMALAPSSTLICNGYKDRAYMRLALIGSQLGHHMIIVIEKPAELEYVLQEARSLRIRPRLGVRIRLSSISSGKWQNSGGDRSKFGLHAGDVLRLIERLKSESMLDTLELMHFHMGSQVAQIADIKTALREAARHYGELTRAGAQISTVDVGGGLGIDYEGSRSSSDCSINYSMKEYADAIVRAFADAATDYDLPAPDIFTESGRAMTAHHAVLVTNVTDVESVDTRPPAEVTSTAHPILNLNARLASLQTDSDVLPSLHDAQDDLAEVRSMYLQGKIGMPELAEAERLSSAIHARVRSALNTHLRAHQDQASHIDERLADKVFCNFSVFQSIPDAWAIEQIFPVMPLQRLDEQPSRRAILQDLTCDSDGHIARYIDGQNISTTMPIHLISPGEDYLLGIFLVGAYQEIIGDMHNLFGDTHAVNIGFGDDGSFHIEDAQIGDGSDILLRYVHIDPDDIAMAFRRKLLHTDLGGDVRKLYESELVAAVSAYTYLESVAGT